MRKGVFDSFWAVITRRWMAAVLMGMGASSSGLAETLLLRADRVHPVSGPALAPGEVLIRDGKIAAVGARLAERADRTNDLRGLQLFPGLIAAGSSLGLTEINSVRATVDTSEVGGYTPDVRSWIACNPDSELIPVARAGGIAHALVVPEGGVVSGQSGLIQLAGWTVEDLAVKKPVALHVFWPAMDLNLRPREEAKDRSKWKSPDDQAKERAKRLKALEDFFDEARAYARAREADPATHARVPAWEAMLPVVRGELPVIVHADDPRQIKAAVAWAESRGMKMILAGARQAAKVADLLAAKKVPVIYDRVFALPATDTDGYEAPFATPGVLHRAGVKVCLSMGLGGTGASSVRNLPYAAAQAMAYGLPRDEALKSITLNSAEALGVGDRLGSIEPGKDATLIAVDGDILDVRSNVKRMWIAGREVSLESRHTRLYEKYRNRPKP
jgi:imidazolonepropionase-like amidohydrolase